MQVGQGGIVLVVVIQCVCVVQVQGVGNGCFVVQGQEDDQVVWYCLGQVMQEWQCQCWGVVVFGEGLQIEVMYGLQVVFVCFVVVYDLICDVMVGQFGVFLVDVFVVFVVYCCEEFFEVVLVVRVVLLELDVFMVYLVSVEYGVFCIGMEIEMC